MKDIGLSILMSWLHNQKNIIGTEIENADEVIFPSNIASQKAFINAGFVFQSAHPDGEAYNYCYQKVISYNPPYLNFTKYSFCEIMYSEKTV